MFIFYLFNKSTSSNIFNRIVKMFQDCFCCNKHTRLVSVKNWKHYWWWLVGKRLAFWHNKIGKSVKICEKAWKSLNKEYITNFVRQMVLTLWCHHYNVIWIRSRFRVKVRLIAQPLLGIRNSISGSRLGLGFISTFFILHLKVLIICSFLNSAKCDVKMPATSQLITIKTFRHQDFR